MRSNVLIYSKHFIGVKVPAVASRSKYTVKPRQVDSGFRHQGRQFGNEVHRVDYQVQGADHPILYKICTINT